MSIDIEGQPSITRYPGFAGASTPAGPHPHAPRLGQVLAQVSATSCTAAGHQPRQHTHLKRAAPSAVRHGWLWIAASQKSGAPPAQTTGAAPKWGLNTHRAMPWHSWAGNRCNPASALHTPRAPCITCGRVAFQCVQGVGQGRRVALDDRAWVPAGETGCCTQATPQATRSPAALRPPPHTPLIG